MSNLIYDGPDNSIKLIPPTEEEIIFEFGKAVHALYKMRISSPTFGSAATGIDINHRRFILELTDLVTPKVKGEK